MSSPSLRAVPASFRAVLRAVRDTFKGDARALATCRAEARKQFRANAGERDAARVAKMVADALDAAQFLRDSVVQAALNDKGNYAMKLKPQPGSANTAVQHAAGAEKGAGEGAGGGGGGGCGKTGGCGCG
jgi:complex III assembly factor LYRM7